ncbi:trafficking protein particle complex subunit 14-like isoform X2 [Lytechinus variegatus]|uniref:trafficking protein particle complex subunit 14-like isoform X2 n=1 Tax=Lytechinus variegatus TaxID=7654 RepID=UPI001BB1056D|nr:trafficking protein particle complex subunit 14-like isoform X2 [Lytechinus variegatus]
MEGSLTSLVREVDKISIVLPKRYPKSWVDVRNEGHRKYVYGGELLHLALVVSLSKKNGQPEAVEEAVDTWEALSFASSAGYTTPGDSPCASRPASLSFSQQRSQSVDYPDQSGGAETAEQERDRGKANSSRGSGRRFSESSAFHTDKIRCLSFMSVPVREWKYEKAAKSKMISRKVEVVPCLKERTLVLPMSVSLGSLPEGTGPSDTHIATVNVDISEARASCGKREDDRIDMLLQCPMEEVIHAEEEQNVIHNVCNSYPEELVIQNIQVYVNKNINMESASASTALTSDAGDWSSFLWIELLPSQRDQSSTSLHPKEEHTFVFQVTWDCSLPSNRPNEPVDFPLFLVIEWNTPSIAMKQSIQSHYHLPTVTMDFPAFIVLSQCQSPVTTGKSFTVTYTLLNNLRDFLGITLIWIPDREPRGDSESRIADRIVCQEPTKQLGPSKKGSTIKVPITFQALKAGVQELGKFMKLRLQYASKPVATRPPVISRATQSPKPLLKSTYSSSSSSSTSSSFSSSSSSASSITSKTSSPAILTASTSSPSLPISEPPLSSHEESEMLVSKERDSSPILPRRMFSMGPNSALVKKGGFTRQMSLATPSSHPIKKFLAGIRSHSFSGESGGDHQDNHDDNIPRDRSSGSDPGIRPLQKKVQLETSSEDTGLSVERIVKHRSQVYITP